MIERLIDNEKIKKVLYHVGGFALMKGLFPGVLRSSWVLIKLAIGIIAFYAIILIYGIVMHWAFSGTGILAFILIAAWLLICIIRSR